MGATEPLSFASETFTMSASRHSIAHHAAELGRTDSLGPELERLLGYALVQGNRVDEGYERFEESLRLAREAHAQYEVALTLQALGNPAEAGELFERLGMVATPAWAASRTVKTLTFPVSGPSTTPWGLVSNLRT